MKAFLLHPCSRVRGATSEPPEPRTERPLQPRRTRSAASPEPRRPFPMPSSRSYLPPSPRPPPSTRPGGAGRAAQLPPVQPWLGHPSAAPRSHFPSRGRTSREGRRDGTGRPAQVTRAGREEWPGPATWAAPPLGSGLGSDEGIARLRPATLCYLHCPHSVVAHLSPHVPPLHCPRCLPHAQHRDTSQNEFDWKRPWDH